MLSFQSLMAEDSDHPAARGYFVRSVAVNANDFRYGDCRELELANVWSIPSRGIIAVCCEGHRPVDEDAVSLSAIAYNAAQLGKAIGDVVFAPRRVAIPFGVAVVTRSVRREMYPLDNSGSVVVDLEPESRGEVLGSIAAHLEMGDVKSLPFLSLVVRVKPIEDAQPDEDESEAEEKPEPADYGIVMYEPFGPVKTPVPTVDVELQDIFVDSARAVIVTGRAAHVVLAVHHDQSDRLTLPLDDSCLPDEMLEHAMWHLANTIQRGKVGQWLVGLHGHGLEPLVAELWNCNESFSVYVTTVDRDGLCVRRLLIEERLVRVWLAASHGIIGQDA
jgi:hypothetical protein